MLCACTYSCYVYVVVTASNSNNLKDDIEAGTIAGIVIGLLIFIIVIFTLFFVIALYWKQKKNSYVVSKKPGKLSAV